MKKVEFVVDSVEADEHEFYSSVLSKKECERIKKAIQEIKTPCKKLTYLLNVYAENGLEFVSAENLGDRSFSSFFMGPSLWIGDLIFRKIQD